MSDQVDPFGKFPDESDFSEGFRWGYWRGLRDAHRAYLDDRIRQGEALKQSKERQGDEWGCTDRGNEHMAALMEALEKRAQMAREVLTRSESVAAVAGSDPAPSS